MGRSPRLAGPTLRGYKMPTKHERIGVVKDAALAQALDSVVPFVGRPRPLPQSCTTWPSAVPRRCVNEATRRDTLLRELAAWSTGDDPPWDVEVLARIDDLAAGASGWSAVGRHVVVKRASDPRVSARWTEGSSRVSASVHAPRCRSRIPDRGRRAGAALVVNHEDRHFEMLQRVMSFARAAPL